MQRLGKKFLNLILSLFLTFSCSSGVAGCGFGGNDDATMQPSGKPVPPATVDEMTFKDLAQNNKTIAREFCENFVEDQVLEEMNVSKADVKEESVSWRLDGSEKVVTSATMSFIYNVDETNRTFAVATADFNAPISAQSIKDGEVSNATATVTHNAVYTFNAKDNYNNQDITNALYNATNTTSSIKLYSEAEATEIDRVFNIVNVSDDQITITNVNVTKGDESKDTLLKNLTNRAEYGYRTTSTVTLEGISLNEGAYTLENLGGSEVTDPEKPPVVNPGDETHEEATSQEIISALDENCKESVLKAHNKYLNQEFVKDGQWFVTKNEDGKITKAEYLFKYQTSETGAYIAVSSVEFKTPLDAKEINSETITNATYNKGFSSAGYDPSIQSNTNNVTLANAICDKLFGEKIDATRFIIHKNPGIDNTLKNVRNFQVIEIFDNHISQQSIAIKDGTDTDVIEMLENESNFKASSLKEYTIQGEKLIIN